MSQPIKGVVERGKQEAAGFLSVDWVEAAFIKHLGYIPFPGTLNLRVKDEKSLANWRKMRSGPSILVKSPNTEFCDASLYKVTINGDSTGAIVVPHVDNYPEDVIELVSPEGLRNLYRLAENHVVELEAQTEEIRSGRDFTAVLFDFEGTLVDFQWQLAKAEAELRKTLSKLGYDLAPFRRDNYAQLRTRALKMTEDEKLINEINTRFGEIYDRYDDYCVPRWNLQPGAAELLNKLKADGKKVAIISNIGRVALEKAMAKLGLTGIVDTIVTRNDVTHAKPSGEGILKVLNGWGVDPSEALMVGDSFSDLLAAEDAGTSCAILLGGESPAAALAKASPDHLIDNLAALEKIL